ncbi:MAG: hypothetical protein JNK87_01415 [Bryobacterales bacterium]|nr:hypothetical protein [Bryobacterales bacterium]
MWLEKFGWPKTDLLRNQRINRRHEGCATIQGEPTPNPKDQSAPAREAFAALVVAGLLAGSEGHQVTLGDEAIQLLYGRTHKKKDEKDCDVVGKAMRSGQWKYVLADGKGSHLAGAVAQFEAAATRLPAGSVWRAYVVTNSLRYWKWHVRREQWVAWKDTAEDQQTTRREGEKAADQFRRDRVFLLNTPGARQAERLSNWCIDPLIQQPFQVYEYFKSPHGGPGSFSPVRVAGTATLWIYYVD